MLLQAVDVKCDLVVHSSGGLKQNVESQQHPSRAIEPLFRPEDRKLHGSNQAAFCIANATAAMSWPMHFAAMDVDGTLLMLRIAQACLKP